MSRAASVAAWSQGALRGREDAGHPRVQLAGVRAAPGRRALNCASTMWCALRPYGTCTCRRSGPGRRRTRRCAGSAWCRRRRSSAPCRSGSLVHEVGAAGEVDRGLRPAPRPAAPVRSPKRRMPTLSPSACGRRAPSREGGVLDRVVGVDVQVAVGLHVQVEQAVPAELVEHVVVEADAGVRRRSRRVPSRSISTRTLGLLGGAVDAAVPAVPGLGHVRHLTGAAP